MSLVDYQSSSEESDDNDSAFETQLSAHTKQAVKEPIKKREPVKITVPSLAEEDDDDDDEEENSKKKLKVNNSSNLLGLLPAPKHLIGKGDTLTPYVLTKKKEQTSSVKVPKVPPSVSFHSYERTSEKASINSAPEPESPTKCDFFSLQSFDKIEDVPLPGETPVMFKSLPTPVTSTFYAMSDIPLPSSSPSTTSNDSLPLNSEAHPSSYSTVESYSSPVLDNTQSSKHVLNDGNAGQASIPQEPEDIMNDERFRRLHGKRGKAEDLNIIDVNLEKELPNQTEWHTKSLTEEKNLFHSRQKHHMPTQQQKRKHQITYLAFQAKERELDLKNQWAQNRLTKRETQAKYGF